MSINHNVLNIAANSKLNNQADEPQTSPIKWTQKSFGIRHLHVALIFTCLAMSYIMRVNLSVAIVAMIDKNTANPDYEEFKWNEKTQSLLLSSFFWGYIITPIAGGQLSEKYGSKFVLLASVVLCAIIAIITPICTSYGGWKALCALRVMSGLCQGVVYPSSHTLLSKWAPPSERGPLATYSYVGAEFGAVLALSISGILASSSMGWPSIFYFSGGISLVWAVIWFWLGSSSPVEHKYISEYEKEYIVTSLKTIENVDNGKTKMKLKTPWMSIAVSMPLLALVATHAAQMWGFWTLLTKIPAYMKNVLKFDIKENALFSALPYLAKLLLGFGFSFLSTYLDKKRYLSVEFSRKFFNSIGQWIPALATIGLGYVSSDNPEVAIVLLTLSVGMTAAAYLGFQVNHIDLAPNFAGTLMGISNAIANLCSIIAPLIIGFIVSDETDVEQWRIIFFIAAGIYFLGNLLFVVFGKTRIQPWNEPKIMLVN